jgi:ABC-2 type transport system permease protein
MGSSPHAPAEADLLCYRPWTGTFREPWLSVWPIARVALLVMLRRKLFWVLYLAGMLIFMMFFFGQYLAAFTETLSGPQQGGNLRQLIHQFVDFLDGTGKEYRAFIHYQGYIVMIVLALTGSVVIGNDVRYGSLPFYLSKPVAPAHYLIGKGLAVTFFINLMTTLPALILFIEFGLLYRYSYFWDQAHLLLGILGYGALLTVSLTLVLLASALWLRHTVPLIMLWTTLFVLGRLLSGALVGLLGLDPRWRLIDLWGDMFLVGNACLRMPANTIKPERQPSWEQAALVLAALGVLCLIYLVRRIRGVEVVR